MDELRELYQSTILDHNKKPRNFRALDHPDRSADGHNPLCGDKLTVEICFDDEGRIGEIGFQGSGCAISTASASLMTELARGRSAEQIEQIFQRFHQLVTSSPGSPVDLTELGKLAVFSGVREYPMRIKCATLAWHTLRAALEGRGVTARTE
jgi:nitrogen fixation NifU-like protein